MLQKRVLLLFHFADKQARAIPLFKNTNILPINMLYFKSVSSLMYDITNGVAPNNISDLFIQIGKVHLHSTRSSIAGN